MVRICKLAWAAATFAAIILVVSPVYAQVPERHFSDDQVKDMLLEICRNGPERQASWGRQLARTFIDLGWRQIGTGKPFGAAELFISALNAVPENPGAYWGLGVAAHIAGFSDGHLNACFGKTKELLPDHPGPWGDHGRAVEERGNAQAAVPLFLESLKRDENYLPAHIGLARAYARVGDEEGAKRHAQRANALRR